MGRSRSGSAASESSEGCPAIDSSAYGDKEWAQQFLGHIIHSCTVLICKPYRPSEAERKDPKLFKENVRELMRQRLVELHEQEERKRAEREARPSMAKGLEHARSLWSSVSKNVAQGADQVFADVHQGIMHAWRDLGPKPRGSN